MATRKTPKLKFGSPAWQKKYNPAFKGGKKKKAAKRTTKKAAKRTTKVVKCTAATKMYSTAESRRRGSSTEAKYVGKLAGEAWSGCISAKPLGAQLYDVWEILSVAEAHAHALPKVKGAIKKALTIVEKSRK